MRRAILPTLLLVACDPFGHLPDEGTEVLDQPLWDDAVAAAADGLYIRLPAAGRLARLTEDGSWSLVDLDGLVPEQLAVGPGGAEVVVFGSWPECDDPDPSIETIGDCPEDALAWHREMAVVAEGERQFTAALPSHINAVTFTDDGRYAIAYHDEARGGIEATDGIVDLTQVVVVDVENQATTSVSIGFNPTAVLFTEDGARAVVMSRSQVVVVDLASADKIADYPLVLDADQQVQPSDAVLTPDGRYALVSIEDRPELYVLDLENPNIDIEDLEAAPSDLATWSDPDDASDLGLTVVAYGDLAQVDLLDHESFEFTDGVPLDEPVTDVLVGEDFAVLANTASSTARDVVRLDLRTGETTEYRVENPVEDIRLDPSGTYAVAVMRPESAGGGSDLEGYQDQNWGLAVIDLAGNDAVSLVVEAEPVGLSLLSDDTGSYGLVLMDGVDTLFELDLGRPGQPQEVELPASPTGIGRMPGGSFYITYDAPLGLVSFLDPSAGEPVTHGGFATAGMLVDQPLPRRGDN